MDASGYKSLFLGLLMVPVLGMEGWRSRRSWKGRGPVVVWKDDGRECWGCWHHNPTIPLLLDQEATAAANASGQPSDTQETTERNLRALLPRQCHVKCQGFSSIKLDPSREVWGPLPCLSFLAGDLTSVEHTRLHCHRQCHHGPQPLLSGQGGCSHHSRSRYWILLSELNV